MIPLMNRLQNWPRSRSCRDALERIRCVCHVLVCRFLPAALLRIVIASAHAQAPGLSPTPPVLLTNAQQIVALSNNIPSGAYEARFQAVVIYVSPPTRRLYVQDGDLGVQVNLLGSVAPYRAGNLVEVSGTVLGGEPALRLVNAKAVVVRHVRLPEPPLVSVHLLVQGKDPFRYVKLRGVVRDMYSNRAGMTFLLTQDNYPFEPAFQTVNAPLPRQWMDSRFEVSGQALSVLQPHDRASDGDTVSRIDTNSIHVLKPGIADRFDGRPLLTIAEAAKLPNDSAKPVTG